MDFIKLLKEKFGLTDDKVPPLTKWCNEIDKFRGMKASRDTFYSILLKEKEFETYLIQSGLGDIDAGYVYTDSAIRIKNDIYFIRQTFRKMRYEVEVKLSDTKAYDRDLEVSNQYDKLWRGK